MTKRPGRSGCKPFVLAVLLTCAFVAVANAQPVPKRKTLTVINFVNRSLHDKWDWLQIGLADMLITDLHRCGRFQMVTREDMQGLFNEMNLSESGLVALETASQFGNILSVGWVVFGSYFWKDGMIEIECHIVEVSTQKLRRVEFVRGPDSEVLHLEKQLALKIVKNFDVTLNEDELATLKTMQTVSLDAAQYYYDAMSQYDHGSYLDALVLLRQAVQRDSEFAKARFHLGMTYYDCGEKKHALAELEKVAVRHSDSYYGSLASFIAGEIEECYLDHPMSAARHYLAAARNESGVVNCYVSRSIAAIRAGLLFEEMQRPREAYEAFRFEPLRRKEARDRVAAYLLLWHLTGSTMPQVPDGYLFVSANNNTFGHIGSGPGGLLCDEKDRPPCYDRAGVYYLFAEKGYAITGLTLHIETRPNLIPNEKPDEGMQFCNFVLSDICGNPGSHSLGYQGIDNISFSEPQKATASVTLRYPVIGCKLHVREGYDIELTKLNVVVELDKAPESLHEETKQRVSNLLTHKKSDINIMSISAHCDRNGKLNVLSSERVPWRVEGIRPDVFDVSHTRNADMWITDGEVNADHFRKLRINSLQYDYHPSLVQDENMRYWLVFCSQRQRKRGVGLWITSSMDCRNWTYPRRIDLDVEWENRRLRPEDWERFKRAGSPRLVIDRQGIYWLAFWLGEEVLITNSPDGYNWRKPVNLGPLGVTSIAHSIVLCEGSKGSMIVAFKGVYWHLKPNRSSPDSEEGILIARVSGNLQFERRQVKPGFPYTQVKYGWPGNGRPLAMRRLADGRFLLMSVRNREVYASVSGDLEGWHHHKVADIIDRNALVTCVVDESMHASIILSRHGKLVVKDYALGPVLSVQREAGDQEAIRAKQGHVERTRH